jgi:protein-disulfide isomerase
MIQESNRVNGCAGWIWVAASLLLLTAAFSAAGQTGTKKLDDLYLCGQPNSPVKIEVFSDFQCPVCGLFYTETIKPLVADYASSNKVYIVYHDFPLDMHPLARRASLFALAARRLGRGPWLRVADALYREQAQWSQDGNIEAALARVLDPTELVRLKKLAADPTTEAALRQEIMLGQSRNINATPTLFIITESGRQQRVNSGLSYTVLKDFLERTLRRQPQRSNLHSSLGS